MNIQSAVKEATIVLKNNYIKTAELDSEILLAETLGLSREYIICLLYTSPSPRDRG